MSMSRPSSPSRARTPLAAPRAKLAHLRAQLEQYTAHLRAPEAQLAQAEQGGAARSLETDDDAAEGGGRTCDRSERGVHDGTDGITYAKLPAGDETGEASAPPAANPPSSGTTSSTGRGLSRVNGHTEAVQNVLKTDLAEEESDEEGGPTPTLCSCCSLPAGDDWAAWEVANVECVEEKQAVVEGVESALDWIE